MFTVTRALTVLLGVLLAGPFALRWLLAPESGATEMGIQLSGPASFSHLRGDTGGAFFAIGVLAVLGVFRKEPGYLEAVALIMVCIAAARLYGIAVDGYQVQIGVAIGVEVVTAAAAFLTARQLRAGVT